MPKRVFSPLGGVALLAALALGASALSSELSAAKAPKDAASEGASCAAGPRVLADGSRPACCFTNPAYAGVCRVEPGKGETCDSILDYLNSGQSTGKTYCESTLIRGGWDSVPCGEKTAPEEGAER